MQVITADGFELQFAVNALSPFQLTLELLPALEMAAPSPDNLRDLPDAQVWQAEL